MAPWTTSGHPNIKKRRDSFSGDFPPHDTKGSSGPTKESVKIITQQVTFTSTIVHTSVALITATEDNDNDPLPTDFPTLTAPTPPASSTGDSSATPTNTSSILPSPSLPSTSLPVASIISIILSGLFFITLCLVIYVRSPTIPSRILGAFKRRYHRQPPSTIRSFEPMEYKDYTRNDHFRQSLRSYLALSHLRYASSKAVERSPNRVGSPSASHANSGLRGDTPLIFTNNSPGSEHARTISGFSGFDDLSYAQHSENSKTSVKLSDWYSTTTGTPYSIPRSVDQMTAE